MQKLRAERAKQAERTGKCVGEHKEKCDRETTRCLSSPTSRHVWKCVSVYVCTLAHAVAVFGTGCPGRNFFMIHGGTARAVKKKKKNPLRRCREAVFYYYLSFHCVGANWRRCLLRRCRAQKLCEKGKGARRGGQFTSGSLPDGTDKGGGIHCMQWFSTRGPSRIQMRPNMLNHGRRQGGAFAGRNPQTPPPPRTSYCAPHFPSSPLLAERDRFRKRK